MSAEVYSSGGITPVSERRGVVEVSAERENLTVEVCRERAEAFRAKAVAEPREEKKGLYLALAESWTAIAAGLATLSQK